MKSGGSIEKLRELVGHSTVLVTERYATSVATCSRRPTTGESLSTWLPERGTSSLSSARRHQAKSQEANANTGRAGRKV